METTKTTMIDDTKRLLLKTGAAVAANGGEFVQEHLSALKKMGIPRAKMDLAVNIGHCVQERRATCRVAGY